LPRHAKAAGPSRLPRLAAVVLVWLVGLVVGFFGVLSVAARYGCGASQNGLACRPAGTALGVAVIVAVIVVVTTITLLTFDRKPAWIAAWTMIGLVALGLCYLGAQGLLGTA
jgi:hypothetical protein